MAEQVCPHCRKKITEEDTENLRLFEEFKSKCGNKRSEIHRTARFALLFCVAYLIFGSTLSVMYTNISGTMLLSCFVVLAFATYLIIRSDKRDRDLFERYKKDFSYPPQNKTP